jgi:hypothetical protein
MDNRLFLKNYIFLGKTVGFFGTISAGVESNWYFVKL